MSIQGVLSGAMATVVADYTSSRKWFAVPDGLQPCTVVRFFITW